MLEDKTEGQREGQWTKYALGSVRYRGVCGRHCGEMAVHEGTNYSID